MKHTQAHPFAGRIVRLRGDVGSHRRPVTELIVEDWNDRVFGRPWMLQLSNPACMAYAIRVPRRLFDNEVVYGHTVDGVGCLVHASELRDEPEASDD